MKTQNENDLTDLFGKAFSIRRDVLNLSLEEWHVADTLDLSSITPRRWMDAIGGKGGFLTALMNDEEREFVRIVFLPNSPDKRNHKHRD